MGSLKRAACNKPKCIRSPADRQAVLNLIQRSWHNMLHAIASEWGSNSEIRYFEHPFKHLVNSAQQNTTNLRATCFITLCARWCLGKLAILFWVFVFLVHLVVHLSLDCMKNSSSKWSSCLWIAIFVGTMLCGGVLVLVHLVVHQTFDCITHFCSTRSWS